MAPFGRNFLCISVSSVPADATYRVSMEMKISMKKTEKASQERAVRETGGNDTAANTRATRRKGNGYIEYLYDFTSDNLPLDRPYEGASDDNVTGSKFGAHGKVTSAIERVTTECVMWIAKCSGPSKPLALCEPSRDTCRA